MARRCFVVGRAVIDKHFDGRKRSPDYQNAGDRSSTIGRQVFPAGQASAEVGLTVLQ
jgi:hypothetical protein